MVGFGVAEFQNTQFLYFLDFTPETVSVTVTNLSHLWEYFHMMELSSWNISWKMGWQEIFNSLAT
jgi:hypothetical protein